MANGKIIPLEIQEPEKVIFDKNALAGKNLHLSIEVREYNVRACFLDKDANKYLAWSSYSRKSDNNIKRLLGTILKEEIFSFKCSSASVVFVHNNAMLIPAAFFSQELLRDYLKHQNLMKPGERACADFIKNNDCYSVYAADPNDYHLLKEKYPHATFRHHSSVFVEYLLALNKSSNRNEVHVYVFPGYMDVVVLQAGKLLLYNRYHIQTANDFTYFLLWVYEELKLKPEDSSCILYGEITEKSEVYELAKKYVAHIRMAERTNRFIFSRALETLPAHAYYSLFMQYLCI
jgi:hypothetical protein